MDFHGDGGGAKVVLTFSEDIKLEKKNWIKIDVLFFVPNLVFECTM